MAGMVPCRMGALRSGFPLVRAQSPLRPPTHTGRNYLFEITKSTVLTWLPLTVTDFSQVLGSVNTGRSTL